jgi:hypothetical protein
MPKKETAEKPEHPSFEQCDALIAYASEKGVRAWKSALLSDWSRSEARIGGDTSPELQQVRNAFGPAWLRRISLNDIRAMRLAAKRSETVQELVLAVAAVRDVIATLTVNEADIDAPVLAYASESLTDAIVRLQCVKKALEL